MYNRSSSSVWQQHLLKNAGHLKLARSSETLVELQSWTVLERLRLQPVEIQFPVKC